MITVIDTDIFPDILAPNDEKLFPSLVLRDPARENEVP